MPDIHQYLTPNEQILQEWKAGSLSIYATNKRIITKEGGQIGDLSYSHISSVDYERQSRVGRILSAIGLIIIGIFITVAASVFPILYIFVVLIFIFALILIFTSAAGKTKIYVVGREPIELSGKMDSLLRWIREYKTAIETTPEQISGISRTAYPQTPRSTEPPPTREELLRSAMKALDNGDHDLARKFLEQARLS